MDKMANVTEQLPGSLASLLEANTEAAHLRSLRALPAIVPHVSRFGKRERFTPRANLPDARCRRGEAGHRRGVHVAHRLVPRLSRLRVSVPVKRALWSPAGSRARRVSREKANRGSMGERLVRLSLNRVFTRPFLLRLVMAAARCLRDSGLARLAFETNLFGRRLGFGLAMLVATH